MRTLFLLLITALSSPLFASDVKALRSPSRNDFSNDKPAAPVITFFKIVYKVYERPWNDSLSNSGIVESKDRTQEYIALKKLENLRIADEEHEWVILPKLVNLSIGEDKGMLYLSLRSDNFVELASWVDYVINTLLAHDVAYYDGTVDEMFDEFFQSVREDLSFNPLSNDDLDQIKTLFEARRGDVEKALEVCSSISKVKWSNQKEFQAFMGHLFFPVQFDRLFETTSILHTREYLQFLVALSASYKNVLAQYHLQEIVQMYEDSYINDDFNDIVDRLVKTPPAEHNEPHYYCGLLCVNECHFGNAFQHYKLGHEKGDSWCSYRYGLEFLGEEESKPIIAKLMQSYPGLAKLLQAELELDDADRIAMYVDAGKDGVAEGYDTAGLLEDNQELSYSYYLKAAHGHILGAYDKAAQILLENNMNNEAANMYYLKGQSGDDKGFVQGGDLLRVKKQYEEANVLYQKAGLRGYGELIHNADKMRDKKKLRQEREDKKCAKIKKLKEGFYNADI